MDPREFLSFIRRRWFSLLITALLFFGVSMGVTQQSVQEEGALIFLTMGATLPENVSIGSLGASQNENVVDQFTQTVQGWVSNPGLVRQVEAQVDRPFSLSVRKQEKQNLIVTLYMDRASVGEMTPELAANVFLEVLNQELAFYNELTNASFVVAISSIDYFETSPQWTLNGLVGILFGLMVGVVGFGLWEYVRRTLTFEFQVISILGGLPLLRLSSTFSRSDLEGFIHLYVQDHEKVSLLEVGETGMLQHKSYLKENGIEVLTYPEGLKHFKSSDSLVAVIRLGESQEDAVRALSLLVGKQLPYFLIV